MGYLREHFKFLTETGKYPGVDLLRALAVGMVILFHYRFLQFGWIGVDLFFVISGFLIGGIIIDASLAGRFSFKEFYRNRILRIIPIYYLMIVLSVWLKAGDKPFDAVAIKSIITGMFFLQTTGPYYFPDFFIVDHSFLPGGAWSLVVEEMFYLFAPLVLTVLVLLAKRRLQWVVVFLTLIVASGYFVRWKMTNGFMPDDGNWHFVSFIQFHSRYDELAAGVLVAAIVRCSESLRKYSSILLFISASFLTIFLYFLFSHPEFYKLPQTIARDTRWIPTVLAIGWGSALLSMYWWPVKSTLIIFIARLSYPLYLVHILIGQVADKNGFMVDYNQSLRDFLLIGFSLICAYILSLTVEYPFVRLYKKPKKTTIKDAEVMLNSAK